MKKHIKYALCSIIMSTVLITAQNSSALWSSGLYLGMRVGVSDRSETHYNNEGYNTKITEGLKKASPVFAGLIFGVRFPPSLRLDIEASFREILENVVNNSYGDGSINSASVTVNLYYNFLDRNLVKAYINGGLGKTLSYAVIKSDDTDSGIKLNSSLTWLVGAGVTFSLWNFVNLDTGYRFIDTGKINLKNFSLRQNHNEFYVGLRFGF
jgi:opacity protein-like surface antigen